MSVEEQQTKKIRVPCSLREIADNNLFFFDKTLEVIKLTKINQSQAFIARPRHFGKTMAIDILDNLFTGNREIFERLKAKCLNCWDFSQKYTVLRLSFNINIVSYDHFVQTLKNYLFTIAKKYNVNIQLNPKLSQTDILSEILNKLTEKRTKEIVVLIDDFDYCLFTKPDDSSFKPYVAMLGSLVNVFKVYADNIRLLLYFGVHYFTSNTIGNFFHVPPDVSTYPELSTVFGFTREEILDQLPTYLSTLLKLFQQSKISNPLKEKNGSLCETVEDVADYLIYYFGGYRFSPYSSETVLNPYEILSIFSGYRFDNFWIKNVINIDYLYTSSQLLSNFNSIFNAFFNFESFFVECLVPLIKGDLSISPSAAKKYRYILDYGLLTFDMTSNPQQEPMISIPNVSIYEFLANILIQKMSERYLLQLKPIQIDKIDQGDIPQIIKFLRMILISPLVPLKTKKDGDFSNQENKDMSGQSVTIPFKNRNLLLSRFETWEIKVFAALASLGLRITMKIPKSDNFYYAVCETSRCSIHILASTNNDPSIKQILPLLSCYGLMIPASPNKNTIFCVLSCTTFTHTMKFDATWNLQQTYAEWNQLVGKVCTNPNQDFSQFDMSQFCYFETSFFKNNEEEDSSTIIKKSQNLISFIDVVFQVFLNLDSKAKVSNDANIVKCFSVEQITTIIVKVFSNSQPFEQMINHVKMSIQYLIETNKLIKVPTSKNYLFAVKK